MADKSWMLTILLYFLWNSEPVSAVNEVNMCSGQQTNILSGYIRLTSSPDTNNYCQCTSVMGMSFGGTFTLTLTAEQASSTGLDDVCVTVFSHHNHTELANQCFENGTSQPLTLVGDHEGGLMLTFRSVLGTLPPAGSTFSLKIIASGGTADLTCDNTPPPTTTTTTVAPTTTTTVARIPSTTTKVAGPPTSTTEASDPSLPTTSTTTEGPQTGAQSSTSGDRSKTFALGFGIAGGVVCLFVFAALIYITKRPKRTMVTKFQSEEDDDDHPGKEV